MNFTDISLGKGYQIVYIDKKWFLNETTNIGRSQMWNYTIIIMGNKVNPDLQLDNTFSPFKNVNFNIIQEGYLKHSETNSINTQIQILNKII
jgi:hypothetical protein